MPTAKNTLFVMVTGGVTPAGEFIKKQNTESRNKKRRQNKITAEDLAIDLCLDENLTLFVEYLERTLS